MTLEQKNLQKWMFDVIKSKDRLCRRVTAAKWADGMHACCRHTAQVLDRTNTLRFSHGRTACKQRILPLFR